MKLRILARSHDPNAYDTDWQSRVWRWLKVILWRIGCTVG